MWNVVGGVAGLATNAMGSAMDSATRATDRLSQIAKTQDLMKDIELGNQMQRQVGQKTLEEGLKTAAYDALKKSVDDIKQKI